MAPELSAITSVLTHLGSEAAGQRLASGERLDVLLREAGWTQKVRRAHRPGPGCTGQLRRFLTCLSNRQLH